jgi:predicted AAA+ superfamily ATPase
MQRRKIYEQIDKDLSKKMVLLAGPRQCGKTTLAKELLKNYKGQYYNWDEDSHKELIRKNELDLDTKLWVFDEIHKFSKWRNWIKGKYDIYGENKKILVTGSAKLDLYNRGGDSLQGRYYFHRLHPFTYSELINNKSHNSLEEICEMGFTGSKDKTELEDLIRLGGFPEPLFSSSENEARRWRVSYGYRTLREDIRSLENIQLIDKAQDLYDRLPDLISSPLSINSLREDLELNFKTVARWINIFEKNYVSFKIPPFGPPKIRAVKKEQKLYLWDWARVENSGARLENLVALHLLRMCHWFLDIYGLEYELRFFRDTDKREVDFIVLQKKKPLIAIEVKESEQGLDPNLKYLLERVKIPYAFQVHLNGKTYKRLDDINGAKVFLIPAERFLANLP